MGTLTFNAEPTQYLVAAVLRPGNSPAKRGAIGLLRACFGSCARLPDAACGSAWTGASPARRSSDFLEAEGVEYLVAMASNPGGEAGRRLLGKARMRSKTTGETATLFGETRYAARSGGASGGSS